MGKKLAIKGHVSRGKEVIELFKMMGGCKCGYCGGGTGFYYYISQFGNIEASCKPYEFDTYIVYTLEEFLEKYPYKVGDKVYIYIQNDDIDGRYDIEVAEITSMRWNPARCKIAYKMKDINREFYKEEIKCKVDDDSNKTIKDMGKKLAIKGNPIRGEEVIKLLEMMNGKNFHKHAGINDETFYYIDDKNNIDCDCTLWNNNRFTIFTIEEFWEKYPFKIGDRVIDTADGCPGIVCEMKWDEGFSDMKYFVTFGNGIDFGWYLNDSIELCKENENLEETQSNQDIDKVVDNLEKISVKNHKMGPKSKLPSKYYEDRLEESQQKRDIDKSDFIIKHMILPNKMDDKLEYEIIDGYEFDKVENNKIILKPIKPKYPKTYMACCKVIANSKPYAMNEHYTDINNLLQNLQTLLMCRDAYWKIAGEEMGLDKPWEPAIQDTIWGITRSKDEVEKYSCRYGKTRPLEFPTEEMRDAFYENFKDLIEQCKELL